MKGTVSFVNKKEWDGKTLHSFRLVGDDNYYNCGTFDPDVRKGELVEFEGDDKGGGKVQVNVRSVKVLKEAGPQVEQPKQGGFRKGGFTKDVAKEAYWKAREERDVQTQQVIQIQSSRNSAIATADIMLKHGVIDLEKVKAAKKQDTIQSLIDELTEQYQQKSAGLIVPEVVEEPAVGELEETADDWS